MLVGTYFSLPPGSPNIIYVPIAQAATIPPPSDLHALIDFYATIYDVPDVTLEKVIQCESGGNTKAIGDTGTSRGLVQISSIYHPDISDVEAFSPYFSIEYLAKNIATGRGYLWTCYRNLKS